MPDATDARLCPPSSALDISPKHGTLDGMDHLTHEQAAQIRDALWPAFHYLARLKKRMEQVKFPQSDPMFVAVAKAHGAMQDLHVHLHYASCKSGVGVPTRPDGEKENA